MIACFLPSILNSEKFKTVEIDDVLSDIKTEKYRRYIDALPDSIADAESYRAAKRRLPAWALNGRFDKSVKNDCFAESNGLFHFDIDKLSDVEATRNHIISSIPELYALWMSPSGHGLKGLVRIPDDVIHSDAEFKRIFWDVTQRFDSIGVTLDTSASDVRRLCFVSSDPGIYINRDAVPFTISPPKSLPKQPVNHQPNLIDNHYRRIEGAFKNAAPGNRHHSRLTMGRIAGGLVAAGALSFDDALSFCLSLSDAVAEGGATSKSERKTIIDAINDGIGAPVELPDMVMMTEPAVAPPVQPPIRRLRSIEPYPGVMTDLVNETLRVATKQQPELSVLSALIGMAACIGGGYKMPGGQRFNLYGIGISSSGTGKDKPQTAAAVLSGHGGAELGGQPGSGAALEDMLKEDGTKILLDIDEAAHFLAAMNDSKQTHMASLAGYLLKLFTASRGVYRTRRLAASSNTEQRECVNPCVSLLGFACPEKLGEALGHSSNVEDGLLGRILFALGRPAPTPRRDRDEFYLSSEAIDRAKLISSSGGAILSISEDADSRLDELLLDFDSAGVKSSNPFARALKMRSYEKMERIAGVIAIWDDPLFPEIRLQHVNWAESMIRYSDDAVLAFTDAHLHNGKTQTDAARVTDIMRKILAGDIRPQNNSQADIIAAGYVPRAVALKASHLSKKDFDDAVAHLCDLEATAVVELMQGAGRKIKAISLL